MTARRRLLLLVLPLAVACSGNNGTGFVQARFSTPECPPGDRDESLELYRFDDPWMATERYSGILIIMVQEFRVRVEETDGLAVRLQLQDLLDTGELIIDRDRGQIVRSDPMRPIRVPVTAGPGTGQASLSLFSTCPLFPTHHAIDGMLELTTFSLAKDAKDTGRREVLAGTLTATLATSRDLLAPVARLDAAFDFEPPVRPTAEFK